jgi:predicted methyltransferase
MLRISPFSLILTLCVTTLAPGVCTTAAADDLDQIIASRSEEDRARDPARHPAETLRFLQVTPGLTVAESLPGSGWYTRILAPYLGGKGTLYGMSYADRMWPMFSIATDEWIKSRKERVKNFPEAVREYTDNGIATRAFTFATVPPKVAGTVDRVLLIRALHNLHRFEAQAGTLTQAMAAIRGMLKADGLVGVVQHRAPESATDEWADGNNGYLKQSAVIDLFEKAGFELVASSEINANPRDKPGPEDDVWRLPPSLRTSKDNPELRDAMLAIGESDRMTLLFRKAGQAR